VKGGEVMQAQAFSREEVQLTNDAIQGFLLSLKAQHRSKDTIANYAVMLRGLQKYLSPGDSIGQNTLSEWKETMRAEGYSTNTINLRLSVANNLLAYLHRGDLREEPLPTDAPPSPELTRIEYLRLLQTARREGKERTYLLIKLFGSTELTLQELGEITVESINAGILLSQNGGGSKLIPLPSGLQSEMAAYAKRNGIFSGPLFTTRNATLLPRTTVTRDIQNIARDARVPEEKANPRALKKLYQTTMNDIYRNMEILARQTYDRMLDAEQLTIGWEQQ